METSDTKPEPQQTPTPADQARLVLREILVRMGHDLEVEAREDTEHDRILLEITGDSEGELVGNKGETLDALQFLVSRIANRRDGVNSPIVVDDGGYRERRATALMDLAGRLAEQVRDTGETLALNPMSAHDRRIIHMTLRDTPGVTTSSDGDEPLRRVLVEPDKHD